MANWGQISAIISDLDGVTYRGDDPIPSAAKAFQRWHDAGLPYAFVTNNSTKSATQFSDKLNAMGIPARPEQIVASSTVAAQRLTTLVPAAARVMVIGAEALVQAVMDQGFQIADTDVAAVVAGQDVTFTYDKLTKAQAALMGGAVFVGTNPDRMLPHGAGFVPGAGSILAAIEAASGVAPLIIGKPQPDLVLRALKLLGTPASQTCMLGDQLATDIAAGQAAGLPTIRVRTGVAEVGADLPAPDYDVATLLEIPVG